jgi:hypothetical protein
MKSRLIALLVAVASLYLAGRYVYYGSLVRNCIYTENTLPAPEQLTNGEIVVVKDAYLAVGRDREEACLNNSNIDREIIGPEIINNLSIGRRYFTNRGLTVESLKSGTSFRLTGVVAITKHGITTVASGRGPIYYLILEDHNRIVYRIATVGLGLNSKDLFLSFIDSSSTVSHALVKLLSPRSFHETADYEGENSLVYTGRLTELSRIYLKSTEPEWKRLSDRLERGEHFTIMVIIELRDDKYKDIILSNDQEERGRQIAHIQDGFLKKIPSSLVMKNVKKDKSWPYISMEANVDLITYFVDNKADLKIKAMSELIRLDERGNISSPR